jgi:hypothetical protein
MALNSFSFKIPAFGGPSHLPMEPPLPYPYPPTSAPTPDISIRTRSVQYPYPYPSTPPQPIPQYPAHPHQLASPLVLFREENIRCSYPPPFPSLPHPIQPTPLNRPLPCPLYSVPRGCVRARPGQATPSLRGHSALSLILVLAPRLCCCVEFHELLIVHFAGDTA